MNRAQIPVKEYEKLATQFNPVKFDADAWVKLAKDAGMKYIVITSKHHDGFALFGSKVSPYNVVDATPFKRDMLEELAAACAKQGMRSASTTRSRRTGTSRTGRETTGTSAPIEKRTTTTICAGRRSRRCASCSPGMGRWP